MSTEGPFLEEEGEEGYGDEDQPVQFHAEEVDFELDDPGRTARWVEAVIKKERCRLNSVSFIFCSDDYLHQLNVQYLDHDTLTDVITFPYLDPPEVEGDIFISTDRILENATSYGVSFEQELRRVMIHGVLHLCGYSDKDPASKSIMTEKENEALSLF